MLPTRYELAQLTASGYHRNPFPIARVAIVPEQQLTLHPFPQSTPRGPRQGQRDRIQHASIQRIRRSTAIRSLGASVRCNTPRLAVRTTNRLSSDRYHIRILKILTLYYAARHGDTPALFPDSTASRALCPVWVLRPSPLPDTASTSTFSWRTSTTARLTTKYIPTRWMGEYGSEERYSGRILKVGERVKMQLE